MRSGKRKLTRAVEVSVFAVTEPVQHEELIFEVVGVAGQLDDCRRVRESGQIIEPVPLSPLV